MREGMLILNDLTVRFAYQKLTQVPLPLLINTSGISEQ